MQTYVEYCTPRMEADGFPYCEAGELRIHTLTTQGAYDEHNPQFWMWSLFHINRPKCNEIVATLMGRLWDAGGRFDGLDPIGDPRGFLDWLIANPSRTSANVAYDYGVRLLLDDVTGLEHKDGAFAQMMFVAAWVAAMSHLTGKPQRPIRDSLSVTGGAWLRSQCTYEEFCNGLVDG